MKLWLLLSSNILLLIVLWGTRTLCWPRITLHTMLWISLAIVILTTITTTALLLSVSLFENKENKGNPSPHSEQPIPHSSGSTKTHTK